MNQREMLPISLLKGTQCKSGQKKRKKDHNIVIDLNGAMVIQFSKYHPLTGRAVAVDVFNLIFSSRSYYTEVTLCLS